MSVYHVSILTQKKGRKMSDERKFNLKKLPFSPVKNPLMDGYTMTTKNKMVRTGAASEMLNPRTGEMQQAVVVEEQELDDSQFVKVFAAGVRASFGLSLTGARVFQAILDVYQSQPLTGGFADSIYLHFFDGGLSGRKLDLSDRTFRRGLVELLEKGFMYPRGENLYWVNPNLFFRGNRATFIKTYRRRAREFDQEERQLQHHYQENEMQTTQRAPQAVDERGYDRIDRQTGEIMDDQQFAGRMASELDDLAMTGRATVANEIMRKQEELAKLLASIGAPPLPPR